MGQSIDSSETTREALNSNSSEYFGPLRGRALAKVSLLQEYEAEQRTGQACAKPSAARLWRARQSLPARLTRPTDEFLQKCTFCSGLAMRLLVTL